jgi:ABC-type lipoprotein release transport system permease subunit
MWRRSVQNEIGIRIALGAKREHVMRKMLLDGIWPAVVGLVVGWQQVWEPPG